MVDPFLIGSADLLIVGGRGLAYGLGDGPVVLAQNVGVVARDLRADPEVRVSGEHRIERGPHLDPLLLAPAEAATRAEDIPTPRIGDHAVPGRPSTDPRSTQRAPANSGGFRSTDDGGAALRSAG